MFIGLRRCVGAACLGFLCALMTLALTLGLTLVATVTPLEAAHATSQATSKSSTSYLCMGYATCANAGMSHAGYRYANDKMYWRMYSGHNCTNYVAYRLIQSGLPNQRPWSGGGNASNWGPSMKRIRNATPAVGAVAWWAANVPGAGSAGHVAYIEQVVSADEIIVSQDSWGGDFSWARITRSSGRWPTGFLHFNDAELTNVEPPAVTGAPRVGATLSAKPAAWSPSDATVVYQWRADGAPIPDATAATFVPRNAQQGEQITVTATASKLGYPTSSVTSGPTKPVAPGVITNTEPPVLAGEPVVDDALSVTSGTWNPVPGKLRYRWTADGDPIAGATTTTLTPWPELVGKTLAVTVTARKKGYDDVVATSTFPSPVAPGTFTVEQAPTVSGTPLLGQTLSLDPGSYSPVDGDVSIQWLRAGVPVDGATETTYPLTAADLGSRMTAQVTIARAGYTSLVSEPVATRTVRSTPGLHVSLERGVRRPLLTVRVTARGVTPVTGVVQVVSHGTVLAELTLRNGSAHTRLRDLAEGRHTVKIRYLGAATVPRAAVRRSFRIR